MKMLKRVELPLLTLLATSALVSCGNEEVKPEPTYEKFNNKSTLVAASEAEIKYPGELAPRVVSNTVVKFGNTVTSEAARYTVSSDTLNIYAKKYLEAKENYDSSQTGLLSSRYSKYYVLKGFKQFYYDLRKDENGNLMLDEKGNPIQGTDKKYVNNFKHSELTLVDSEQESVNSVCRATTILTYPEELKRLPIDPAEQEVPEGETKPLAGIVLTQYIVPVYELHFFLNNEQIENRFLYADTESQYLAPVFSKKDSELDPSLQNQAKITVSPLKDEKLVDVKDLGYDLGVNGSRKFKVELSINKEVFNNKTNVKFDHNKDLDVSGLSKVAYKNGLEISPLENVYTAEVGKDTVVNVELNVKNTEKKEFEVVLKHDSTTQTQLFQDGQTPELEVKTLEGYEVKSDGTIYNGDVKVEEKLKGGQKLNIRVKKYIKARDNDNGYVTYYEFKGFKLKDKETYEDVKLVASEGNLDTIILSGTYLAPDKDATLVPYYEKINFLTEEHFKTVVSFVKQQDNQKLTDEKLTYTYTVKGNTIVNSEGKKYYFLDKTLYLDVKVSFEDDVILSDGSTATFKDFRDENNITYTPSTAKVDLEQKTISLAITNSTAKIKIAVTLTPAVGA